MVASIITKLIKNFFILYSLLISHCKDNEFNDSTAVSPDKTSTAAFMSMPSIPYYAGGILKARNEKCKIIRRNVVKKIDKRLFYEK
jgi:ribosomal protein L36